MTQAPPRIPLPGVSPLFVERWSPRSFAPTEIDDETLARLFDAARWSPSSFNDQPWRFHTSTRETFDDYLSLLAERNRAWAERASVIGFLIARVRFEHNGNPNRSHALDCGAAWMAMTMQARMEGLYTHGMAGIRHEAIAEYFGLNENESVMMGFAIGKIGDPSQLEPGQQQMEAPSARKSLEEIWFQGR
ncbi:MAG: nitroreductase [Gammaproteobacteria bacterium]|nr:nitroreductase [Gammaproteobacteria bacterium]MYD75809.1 nitroreductase [Gammaproteobacteria bacterium]